ncbi:class I SAM-dependent methyltransferase [Pontiella agarivorans]|uniref:Class I SAM-dependent methyltransferase n=1 Tax=Pontiella agarivorans TaxID=3038953 RepID=A0ABU5MTH7_9BACT|nr:class I SAM-dependent methyltransferase [Pontiella agarivorans]MDZ8117418.1 class I SAM-dependent methyltransferase [Pontiella agarivorans]
MTDSQLDQKIRDWQDRLLSRSARRTLNYNRITSALGSVSSFQCLEISEGDGAISSRLRTLGGSWKTIAATRQAADALKHTRSENADYIQEGKLPFEDQSFDRLVLVDALKYIDDDYAFIRECHRVLRNDGWVVIAETKRAPFSLTALLRQLSGFNPTARGAVRNGYKANELFDRLKDGFDVPETITYSNALLETASAIGTFFQKSVLPAPCWLIPEQVSPAIEKSYKTLSTLAVLFLPFSKLLALFEFFPGHRLLIRSRRRHWRPRLQPKLIDGRSIAEAAINTKIGTAAPF